jgi:4-coumarate--CoA ligase
MLGYTKRKEETDNTVDRDGYLHSGDVAIRDDNGRFYIVDRIKELIKYKGLQVAPAELESLLLKHPKVIDCAVIGVHSEEKSTELPRAYVVVPEDVPRNEKTAQEIQDYVTKSVVDYKRIRGGIVFVDAIPKLASGKVRSFKRIKYSNRRDNLRSLTNRSFAVF